MKKVLFGIISLVVMVGFNSCSKKDPQFYVSSTGYGVQLGDIQFRAVVSFGANYGTFSKELSKMTKDGGSVQTEYFDNYLIETTGTYSDVSAMAGVYSFTGVSTEGKEDNASVKLSFDEPIGELHLADFDYTGREFKMTVTQQVDNATHYGFYYRPMSQNSIIGTWALNEFINYTYIPVTEQDGQEVKLLYYSSNMRYEALMIYPVAIRRTANSLLIRMDLNNGKVLKRGASSFE